MPSAVYPRNGRWAGRIVYPRQIHVGTFDSPEEARAAVEAARAALPREERRRRRRPQGRTVVPSEELVHEIAAHAGKLRGFVLTAAYCGARLFEVSALRASDVDGETLRIRRGKGGRARDVVLFEPALSELVVPESGLLFVNGIGEPWTRQAVNKQWQRTLREVGWDEDLQFRDLRRFHATWLLDRGVSDLDVAVQLGHFDSRGMPNPQLVREVYGQPSRRAALGRLRAMAAA
jgi:integrase